MTDRPILQTAADVRAALDGRKTQARVILKPQPSEQPDANCHPLYTQRHPAPYLDAYCGEPRTKQNPRGQGRNWHWWQVDDRPGPVACRVPYTPGDRLWVREAHALLPATAYRMSIGTGTIAQVEHPTDGYTAAVFREGFDRSGHPRWRPSTQMPRWASRLTYIVTDVRVQRVQDITPAGAIAEGIAPAANSMTIDCDTPSPRDDFRTTWNRRHGPDAWDRNDWVAAITFDVTRANIDQIGGEG